MTDLTAIDVCAGAGGWAVAARGLPIRITHAFDREEDCLLTYKHNHPDVETVQCDVVTHDFSQYRADLVLGGIPCELLSPARGHKAVREGDMDALKALITSCLAVPSTVGARWWCYEDVIGVVKLLPLFTPHFVLDSAEFSPQRRKRAYVGNVPMPPVRNDARTFGSVSRPGPYRSSHRLIGRTPGRASVYNSTQFYPWEPNEKSPTVINLCSRHDNYAAARHSGGWRQLEWQELALLQGFPEDYVFIGSPNRVGKQVGQAVQIETARAILEVLCRELKQETA